MRCVACPDAGVGQIEALGGGKAVDRVQRPSLPLEENSEAKVTGFFSFTVCRYLFAL